MFDCVVENVYKYIKDSAMHKETPDNNPIPSNIRCPKKVDEFLREIVIEAKKGKDIRIFEIHRLIYFALWFCSY